jgi:hypothetical protein
MLSSDKYWITVAEVHGFSRDAARVFTISEWEALTQCLSVNPSYGEIIPDTDGIRVVRWPAASQGKRGCVRVIYYFRDLNIPLHLLAIYEQGERLSPSSTEKRLMRLLVEEVVASYYLPLGLAHAFPGGAA